MPRYVRVKEREREREREGERETFFLLFFQMEIRHFPLSKLFASRRGVVGISESGFFVFRK